MEKTKPAKKSKPKVQDLPDAFSLFKPSWQAFKFNLDAFVLQFLFPVGLLLLAGLLANIASRSDSVLVNVLAIITGLAVVVTGLIILASIVVTELKSAAGHRLTFEKAVREGLRYVWRMIGLFLLSGLIICVGFLLFIVPGIFALQRLLLAPYFLVDQNIGVIEAMKRSFRASKKYSNAIWGMVGVLVAINLIGIIPGIGWAAAAILSIAYLCAPAVRYVQLAALEKH